MKAVLKQLLWVSLAFGSGVAVGIGSAEYLGIAEGGKPPEGEVSFVASVAAAVGPAVVRIDAERHLPDPPPRARLLFPWDSLPDDLPQGTGSGFIVDPGGIVLTNAHVVEHSRQVTVTLQDGRSFSGAVQGVDPITDVGVVRIQGEALPSVTLGDSDQVDVGSWAIAIGNPLGLNSSVTLGIISAVERSANEVGAPDRRVSFLQTDAAINPGNSGGPLLDAQGRVIGVNTAIIQGAQSVGFAIPINTAWPIAQQLITTGKVEHAYIGIRMATLTPELREDLQQDPVFSAPLGVEHGVVILEVLANTPAALGGLRAGDVITALDAVPVQSAEQVQLQVEATGVDQFMIFQVSRRGSPEKIRLKTGLMPLRPS